MLEVLPIAERRSEGSFSEARLVRVEVLPRAERLLASSGEPQAIHSLVRRDTWPAPSQGLAPDPGARDFHNNYGGGLVVSIGAYRDVLRECFPSSIGTTAIPLPSRQKAGRAPLRETRSGRLRRRSPRRWVCPSFIFLTQPAGSVGDIHSPAARTGARNAGVADRPRHPEAIRQLVGHSEELLVRANALVFALDTPLRISVGFIIRAP